MSEETKGSTVEFPFDPAAARRIATYVDGCAFRAIASHYLNPESQITQVVLVQDGYRLEEVGAFFTHPTGSPRETEETLARLLSAGAIKYCVPHTAGLSAAFVSFDEIRPDAECEAFYAPPIYLIRLTGGLWR